MNEKNTKEYICPSCAGRIILNEAMKVYECESCGNTFDFNYFMTADLLGIAMKALSNKEFKTASQMFDLLLKKVPSHFEAKVGKVMADSAIAGMSDYSVRRLTTASVKKNCSKYKDNCTEAQVRFFELYEENAELGRGIYEQNIKKLKGNGKERIEAENAILRNIEEMKKIYDANAILGE